MIVCSGSSPTKPPDSTVGPTALVTRSFGDAPVAGELSLVPPIDTSVWQYTVDLDGNGSPDRAGQLNEVIELEYAFEQSGIHGIPLTFTSESRTVTDTVFVIVNNPAASTIELMITAPERVHGLTLADGSLFTTTQHSVEKRSPESLQVTDSLVVGGRPTRLRGISPSTEGALYVINASRSEVLKFQLPSFTNDRSIAIPEMSNVLVDARRSDRLYTGGPEGVAVVDASDGRVLTQRQFIEGKFFAVGPQSTRIAIAVAGPSPRILMLDGETLEEIWSVTIREMLPSIVAFSAEETVVYVLGVDADETLHYVALAASDGAMIRDFILEPCPFCFIDVGTSAFAYLGSLTLIPTFNGTYVIDSANHLPIHRIGVPDLISIACCDVTSDPSSDRIYFRVQGNSLWRVNIVRTASLEE
jgi:hypothetical protein